MKTVQATIAGVSFDIASGGLEELHPVRYRQRISLIIGLIMVAKDTKKVQEYINEAEHQDGYAYWISFGTLEEVVDDFELFAAS